MRRRPLLVGVLAAAVLIAGCTTVPTSGPVTEHSMEPSGAVTGVRVAPLPPADGATKLLIVEGFLHAMSNSESDYRVAREYLTEAAAKSWKPQSGVQIYADGYPPTETDQTVVLVAPLTGLIDAGGVYRPESGQLRQDFGLVKNSNGQWRISRPPDGLLMSRYLYSTGFTAVDVEFEARTGASMVPDPHHFPDDGTAVSHAAQAVLDGPSPWLAPIVVARQAGEFTLGSVEVSDFGTATVSLSNGSEVSDDRRALLLSEMTYTLCSFPDIGTIRVVVDGQAWTHAGSAELSPSDFADLDPADSAQPKLAFSVSGGKLIRQSSPDNWSDLVEVRSGLPDTGALAVTRDLSRWAITTTDKTQLITGNAGGKIARPLRSGTGLLRPSFARNGDLWSPVAANLAGLRVYREGKQVSVTVSGMPTSAVRGLAIAPDGSRAAVILGRGSSAMVGLARVSYSDEGILISGWAPIDIDLIGLDAVDLLDLGWSSISELALLRRDPQQQVGAVLISQDGSTMSDIGPSDAIRLNSLLVVPGRDPLGLSSTGSLYRFDGEFNWFVVGTEVSAAAYSG
jgi:Lipoprotein LpqB beta-propeller domain/Sporulation and spore germination